MCNLQTALGSFCIIFMKIIICAFIPRSDITSFSFLCRGYKDIIFVDKDNGIASTPKRGQIFVETNGSPQSRYQKTLCNLRVFFLIF